MSYAVLHYQGAVELFVFLDDLLVVQPSNFQVVESKASHRSCYDEVKFPSRQSLEKLNRLTASPFLDADHSLVLVWANLEN